MSELAFLLLRDFDIAFADDVERVPGHALPHDVRAASKVTLENSGPHGAHGIIVLINLVCTPPRGI